MSRPFNIEYNFDVDPVDTVASLKSKIQEMTDFAPNEFILFFSKDNRPWDQCRIEEGRTLGEYGIEEESEISLMFVDGRLSLEPRPQN
jgi:hypothetical protein